MDQETCSAFSGARLVATGARRDVLIAVKAHHDATGERVLVFEHATGRQVHFDLRGTPEAVLARAEDQARPGPGRPRLGVVSREVTLLPRHWEWLEAQPGGNSAALRRLVDEARKREPDRARARRALEGADRFVWIMAGDLPGCEEASRALYRGDLKRLRAVVRGWPKDVRTYLLERFGEAARIASGATEPAPGPGTPPRRAGWIGRRS